MPVVVAVGGATNKQHKIDFKRVAYLVGVEGLLVLKPVLDTVAIVYQVPNESLWPVLTKRVHGLVEAGYQAQSLKPGQGATGYKASVNLALAKSEVALQMGNNKTPSSFRIQFSVDQLGLAGIAELAEIVSDLALGEFSLSEIVNQGKFNRVDIAIDILGCPFEEMLFEYRGDGKSLWYFSADGKPETAYFGKKKKASSSSLYVYNKRQELEDKQSLPAYGGAPYARLERRLKRKSGGAKLREIKWPFNQLELSAPGFFPAKAHGHPWIWSFFLDSCRTRGKLAALELLPSDALRTDFAAALQVSRDELWRPKQIWAHWPAYLQTCGLPILGV